MDRQYILQTADTIRQQLLATTPFNIICSWGALHGFYATVHNNMPALTFKVNGRLFKGNVIIAYNDMDYYEVYIKGADQTKLVHDEVYFDMLGDIIDTAIERGHSQEEYEAFCAEERAKLMRGQID